MRYRYLLEWLQTSECRPIVVASHPRSGTHLLIDCLRLNFAECHAWKYPLERINRLYLSWANLCGELPRLTGPAAIRILARAARPLVKTHLCPALEPTPHDDTEAYRELATWLRQHALFLYTYRDGRDALASQHHMQHWHCPPARRLPLGQFIRQQIGGASRVQAWADHVREWTAYPRTWAVSMERLLADPTHVVRAIGRQFGLNLIHPAIRLPAMPGMGWLARAGRLLGHRPASTAIVTRTRPVPWRRALTHADRQFFADEAGDVLTDLGYEPSGDWVDPAHDARLRLCEPRRRKRRRPDSGQTIRPVR